MNYFLGTNGDNFGVTKNMSMKNLLPGHNQIHLNRSKNILVNYFILFLVFISIQTNATTINSLTESKTSSGPSMIRLNMSGTPSYLDDCVIYYQSGATDDFDSDYDAYKLFGPNPAPHISIDQNSTLMAINGISPVVQTYTTNLRATTHVTGNFTITASDTQDLPLGTCVLLTDLLTSTTVNLLITPYSFNLSSTTTTSRFRLTITYNSLPITSQLTQPTCQLSNGGKFKVTANGSSPWNYTWKNASNMIIKNSTGVNGSDSLINLSNGVYHVEVTSASDACYRNETSFNINQVTIPTTTFSSPDTIMASISTNFAPTNLSVNCENYSWNFGDGIGTSVDFEPNYSFSTPGAYKVKMIGTSNTGCKDSIVKTISVMALTTGVSDNIKQDIKLLNIGNNTYVIKLNSNEINELDIELYDLTGKNLLSERKENLKGTENVFLNFNGLVNGLYLISINHQNKNLSTSKIIID